MSAGTLRFVLHSACVACVQCSTFLYMKTLVTCLHAIAVAQFMSITHDDFCSTSQRKAALPTYRWHQIMMYSCRTLPSAIPKL